MRRFLRLQLALGVYALWVFASEWISGVEAKWQTANKWAPEGVPGAETEVTFTAAHAGKCNIENAERACRSLIMTGYTGTLTLTGFPLKIGSGVAQAENIAIKVPATATISGQRLDFVSTVTATAQTISIASTVKTELRFSKSGKYQLGENLTSAVTEKLRLEAGTLELNAKTLDMGAVEVSGTPTLDATNATIKLRELGMVWLFPATGTLTSTGSTIEVLNTAAAEKTFSGGGLTYGTVTLSGRNVKVEGANKYKGTLNLGNSAAKPEALQGTKLAKSVKQTLEAAEPIAFTGKAGEVSRLESTEAGKQAELEATAGTGDYEPANSFVAVKDINWTRGTLYLPNAESIEGCTKVVKEAKPAAGGALKGSIAATSALAGTAQSPGTAHGSSLATAALAAKGNAAGVLRGSAPAVSGLIARGSASGGLRGHVDAVSGLLARLTAQGGLRGQITSTSTAAARANAPGGLRGTANATAGLLGRLNAAGRLKGAIEAVANLFGKLGAPEPIAPPTFAYIASSELVKGYLVTEPAVHAYVASELVVHAYIGSDL